MNNFDEVILVDEYDSPIGRMQKMDAHHGAHLHRAISVFIINKQGEWLLQQRNDEKYHSKSLWSNACCSHPAPGESTAQAAERRLMQEMGLKAELTDMFNFTYMAELENGLTEHEIDHVFLGITDIAPKINPEEVKAYRYIAYKDLKQEIISHPERFTAWFKLVFTEVHNHIYKA